MQEQGEQAVAGTDAGCSPSAALLGAGSRGAVHPPTWHHHAQSRRAQQARNRRGQLRLVQGRDAADRHLAAGGCGGKRAKPVRAGAAARACRLAVPGCPALHTQPLHPTGAPSWQFPLRWTCDGRSPRGPWAPAAAAWTCGGRTCSGARWTRRAAAARPASARRAPPLWPPCHGLEAPPPQQRLRVRGV